MYASSGQELAPADEDGGVDDSGVRRSVLSVGAGLLGCSGLVVVAARIATGTSGFGFTTGWRDGSGCLGRRAVPPAGRMSLGAGIPPVTHGN